MLPGAIGDPVQELTSPQSPGVDRDPSTLWDGETGHLVWSTTDPQYCHGQETIVYSQYNDGWSTPTVIWDEQGLSQMPTLVKHRGSVFAIWQTDSETADLGSDDEIVMREINGGDGSVALISPVNDDANDRMPVAVSMGSTLVVVWQRWTGSQYDVVARCLDQNGQWGNMTVVSEGSEGNAWSPAITMFQGKAYVAWQSYAANIGNGEGSDILVRWYDGTVWGEYLIDITLASTGENSDVALCVYEGRLRATWRTNDPGISTGNDWDIVMAPFDGSEWEGMLLELTPGDSGDDYAPAMAVFNGGLYVFWQSDDEVITAGQDSDVVTRTLREGEWGDVRELSADDDGRRDGGGLFFGGPAPMPLDNSLIVIWETNTAEQFPGPGDDTWLIYASISNEGGLGVSAWIGLIVIILVALIVAVLALKLRSSGR